MKHKKATPPQGIYYEHLEAINGVKFTPREVDVIACLLSGRGTKTVAHFLSIEEKTVETHKYNVMRKLECNSKESIIDFIEKSDKFSIVKKHYLGLLTQATFEKRLQEILALVGKNSPVCSIVYWQEEENGAPLINRLKNHLKLAGVKILTEVRERHKSLNHLIHSIESQLVDYVIYAPPKSLTTQLQVGHSKGKLESFPFIQRSSKNPGSVIFLLRDSNPSIDLPQGIQDVGYVNFGEQENYYFAVLDILKRILPNIHLDKIFSAFKKQYEMIYGSTEKDPLLLWSKVSELLQKESLSNNIWLSFLQKKRNLLLVGGTLFLGIFCTLFFISKENRSHPTPQVSDPKISTVRSDLPIPQANTLLERSDLMTQLEKNFNGQQHIQTLALVGIGGAGKTTLARQYAHQQKADVIWEINAENHDGLTRSFEDLAQALAKTEEEKKNLTDIKDIKNPSEKEDRILKFVKKRLRMHQNWFLIYDNVEKLADISRYFPKDLETWGHGKVILTTRNTNIQNNQHVNSVVRISELSPNQKLTLFAKIMCHGITHPFTALQIKEAITFLEKIPPFPLDISLAAYYLKATKIPYITYLKNLSNNSKEFEKIQENILKEAGDYPRTRYSIITLSVQHLLKTNENFLGLLLCISLLDSQDIPRDLLEKYKDSAIVDNFIHQLKKYSLILGDHHLSSAMAPEFSLHRSTQEIIFQYLVKSLDKEILIKNVQLIVKELAIYMNDIVEKEDFKRMRLLINHSERFLTHEQVLTDSLRGTIKSLLASIYFVFDKSEKPRSLFEEALNDLHTNYDENCSQIAYTLIFQGIYYEQQGLFEKSKKSYEQGSMIYASLPKNSWGYVWGYAWSLGRLGNLYDQWGDYEKAKDYYEKALLAYKDIYPDNHVLVGWILISLGTAYQSLGKYEQAKTFFEKGYTIYRDNWSDNHARTAWTLVHLGNVYCDLGNFEKAIDLMEKALIVLEENLPSKGHKRIGWLSTHLGNVYHQSGNYNKAQFFLERALSISKKNHIKNHPITAQTLLYLGNVFRDLREYSKAKDLLDQSLEIYKVLYGESHTQISQVLTSLGQLYLLEGHLEKAENLFHVSLNILKKYNHPDLYATLECLAELSLKRAEILKKNNSQQYLNLINQARNFLKEASDIVKTHFSESSPHLVRIQTKLKKIEKT